MPILARTTSRFAPLVVGLLLAPAAGRADDATAVASPPTPERAVALDTIAADSMRGHLSFLASDLLEGRDTPSRGLDLAAEYLAAQFRRAGLEPAGDDGYFQTARWTVVEPDASSFRLVLNVGDAAFDLPADRVGLRGNGPLDIRGAGLVKVDAAALGSLTSEQVEGKAVVVELPKAAGIDREGRAAALGANVRAVNALSRLQPALIVDLDRASPQGPGLGRGRLVEPGRSGGVRPGGLSLARPATPMVTVHDPAALAALDALPAGPAEGSLTLTLSEPVERPVVLRNVAARLPGSDPELRDEHVLVSAHYDHVGLGSPGPGDRIYNGANDDASGTAMVVELASALAKIESRPRRSLLFLAFFGEEKGLLGSRHYGRHPLVPLEKTVALVNLEQVGRTDDAEGPQVGRASLTGFDFSEVGTILRDAGETAGVEVFKHPRNSDAFFGRSDNQALADLGVPAHTLCVAYTYPDYHGVGDHWEKLDYDNMAKVARAVGLGLLAIADRPAPPRWNAENPRAARYLKAWKALHGVEDEGR